MVAPSGQNLRQQCDDAEKVGLSVVDRKLGEDGSRVTINPVIGF